MRYINQLSLMCLMSLSITSFAASPAKNLVENLANHQVNVVKEFNSIGNLKGFVITTKQSADQKSIIYADKQGRYLIAGPVVTPQGQNLAQEDYNKYVMSDLAPKIFHAAQKTHSFLEGNPKAPHKAYILVEPNCVACHMLYNDLKPKIKSGDLAVKWIFVAFMKPQSEGMAAAILESNNPSKAFASDESGFNAKTETGGIKPLTNVSSKTKKQLKENLAFMTKFHFIGTPVVIYQDQKNQYQVIRGYMRGKAMDDAVNAMSNQF